MAKKTSKKAEPEVALEQLVAVAEDFNSFMFDEGKGIDLELEYDELLAEITEAAEDIVEEDFVTAETFSTLKALEIECLAQISGDDEDDDPEEEEEEKPQPKPGRQSTPPKKGKDKKASKKPADSEDNPEPDPKVVELAEEDLAVVKKCKAIDGMKEAAKRNGIVIPPPFLKDAKKMKEYLITKLGDIISGKTTPKKAGEKKAPKVKKEKQEGLNDFFVKTIPNGLGDKHEDEIVVLAKEEFPDKPYRVIGNALYSYCAKIKK